MAGCSSKDSCSDMRTDLTLILEVWLYLLRTHCRQVRMAPDIGLREIHTDAETYWQSQRRR